MVAIVGLLFVCFAIAALRYPPAYLALVMVLTAHGDASGVASFLGSLGLGQLEILTAALAPFVVAKCMMKIGRDGTLKWSDRKRLMLVSWTLVVLISWHVISMGLKTGHFQSMVYASAQIQAYAALVAIAYFEDRRARALLVAVVLWQLFVAAAIVLLPGSPFSRFSSLSYQDVFNENEYQLGITRLSEDTSRFFGQFYNTNQYGFYSVFGLLFGVFLMARGTLRTRLIGMAILTLAAFGWTATFTRGATLGLAVGLVAVGGAALPVLWRRSRPLVILGVPAVAAMALLAIPSEAPGFMSPFAVDAKYDSGVRYRREAFEFALTVMEESPVLGFDDLSLVGGPRGRQYPSPHQTNLYLFVRYGAVSLVCASFLMYWGIAGLPSFWKRHIHWSGQGPWERGQLAFCMILGFMCLGVHFTNGTAGGCLNWISIGIACLPWVVRNQPALPEAGSERNDGPSLRMPIDGRSTDGGPFRRRGAGPMNSTEQRDVP